MSRYTLSKYISRLMAVLLALMMFIGMLPSVSAAETNGTCGDKLSWSLSSGTLTITGSGEMTDFPESTMAPWYDLREEILKIVLPEGLSAIGSLAFYECENLTAVVIPNSVKRIGSYAFAKCAGMELLNLGSGVEVIQEAAFSDCYKVASLTLPTSLRTIGMQGFYRCETITTLTVPSSVTSIGMEAFGYCKSLVSVDIQAQIKVVPEFLFYGCQSLTSVKLPDSVDSVSEMAFRGCDNLDTVYYDGENRTAQEIEEIISKDVPAFDATGNVTEGELKNTAISGTATENSDGTITQENTTVNRGENATISTTVTNKHPADSLSGEITADIVVTVENEDGWEEVSAELKNALKGINDTVAGLDSTSQPTNITVYMKDTDVVDQGVIDELAGRDVVVTIITQDGSVWRFNGAELEAMSESESYDLRYEVQPGSEELCEKLGADKCYVVRFENAAQLNAEVMIRLDPKLAMQNATLFEKKSDPVRIQTTVIDQNGYAHFYLASVTEKSEYYIALNVAEAEEAVIIPSEVQDSYGSIDYAEPIKYEITGVKSSWGMTFSQVTWIMVAVLGGCVVTVGVVMFALNKRKLRMGYVPQWDEDDSE